MSSRRVMPPAALLVCSVDSTRRPVSADWIAMRIAIQSALTGHLVLSTLHTNNAAGGITRLLDMGVEDYLLTSTINGILAQRLVRRLEPTHAQRYPASAEEIERFNLR